MRRRTATCEGAQAHVNTQQSPFSRETPGVAGVASRYSLEKTLRVNARAVSAPTEAAA
jgi:hypothetical protein